MGFKEELEKKVKETIEKFELAKPGEKVLVACSGGKDSTTVLYSLKKFGCWVEGLYIDLLIGEYSKKNLENIKAFCEQEKIKLYIVNIREVLGSSMCFIRQKIPQLKACTVCGVIKRWLLNKKARELGFSKIATGHNLDDQAETMLMNFLKNKAQLNLGQQPKTGVVEDKKFVPRIKPLFFCLNKDIKRYAKLMKFPVLYEKCPCSSGVWRREIREKLESLEKSYPHFRENLVRNFLKILPRFEKTKEKIEHCQKCGEPSRGQVCKFCQLKEKLK